MHFLPAPEQCDICKISLDDSKYMIDGEYPLGLGLYVP